MGGPIGRRLVLADLPPCPFNLLHGADSWYDRFESRIALRWRGVTRSAIGRSRRLLVATIIVRAGAVYRGMRYQHDTERDVPDDVAERMLRERSARRVPMRGDDRADAETLAQAFRQLRAAAMTIER
jgi:hypothetical protein